ncbi:hypothetical protein Cyrtocomes_00013 [Candidatus Cyrtobacter comes]|uniref:Zinc finger CHCC-type domain-containing protein n=1 Tax=Candidatus Cyrtobacter comes TaxID=675776 RepID=A0ABU5L691_9RICK|nr:zinc-finger domain-containing protein [Candidatus Cyrtobacter comes]MDZ5761657.1 hypothetical protein [Candidatus Cyrtobacter comes]
MEKSIIRCFGKDKDSKHPMIYINVKYLQKKKLKCPYCGCIITTPQIKAI